MSERLQVSEANSLLIFLCAKLQGWSKKKIKQRLQGGCVVVNGESVVKHDHQLNVGDGVEVLAPGKRFVSTKSNQANLKLEILLAVSSEISDSLQLNNRMNIINVNCFI